MEAIFHEKQEGSLCAQHCLNALLQGPYFTPVDLSSLAQRMDEEERMRMAECGEESEEYRRFILQPSENMDDSGYFSVQVISSALDVWGLELVPYNSKDARAKEALKEPCQMQAFICNYKDHWFTIRRLGNQWFNLNSLLSRPDLISDTYLALYLAQLRNDGYSIFVVFGSLPDCDADRLLKIQPAVRRVNVRVQPSTSVTSEEDPELAAALRMSLADEDECEVPAQAQTVKKAELELESELTEEEKELKKALRLSLQVSRAADSDSSEEDEEKQLEKAIRMSLECKSASASAPSSPCDSEEVRDRRLAFLNRLQPNS